MSKRVVTSPSPLTDRVVSTLGPNMTVGLCRELEKIVTALEYQHVYINNKDGYMCPVCFARLDADRAHTSRCWLGKRLTALRAKIEADATGKPTPW